MRTSIKAIRIKSVAEDEERIVVTLNVGEDELNRWDWSEEGQVSMRIRSVVDEVIRDVNRDGVFRVWLGDRATK